MESSSEDSESGEDSNSSNSSNGSESSVRKLYSSLVVEFMILRLKLWACIKSNQKRSLLKQCVYVGSYSPIVRYCQLRPNLALNDEP